MQSRIRCTAWPCTIIVAMSLCVMSLLVLQTWDARRTAGRSLGVELRETSAGLHVANVVEGGPAYRSGIVPNDRVVAIDGAKVESIARYSKLASGFTPQRSIEIRVERSGTLRDVDATPGISWSPWTRIENGLVCLICLVVGGIALSGRSRDPRAILLASLLFLTAVEFALPAPVEPFLFYLLTGAQMAVEFHLASSIMSRRAWPARVRGFVPACYIGGLLLSIVGTASYLHDLAGRNTLPWTVQQLDDLIHLVVLPFWAVGVLLLLSQAVVRADNRKVRMQSALVLLGILPWVAYIALGWLMGYPDRGSAAVWNALMPLAVLCYPITFFVAIFRYRLFELEIVVRRGLLYTTLTTTLVLVFYAALGIGSAVFSRIVGGESQPVWAISVATLLLALVFSPLRRTLQRWIDRRFFPERRTMRRRLIGLSSDLPALGTPDRIGRRLVRGLCRIYGASTATLFMAEPTSRTMFLVASSKDSRAAEGRSVTIPLDDPAILRLSRMRRPALVADIFARSDGLAQKLSPFAGRLVVPLCVENRVVGLLLLGERTSGTRYSSEEIELLGLVAHHVANVLDNIRLYNSATYEGLTGLYRRETILGLLEREVARGLRYRRRLTVALVDIDHFKSINDCFGHLEGDRVLRCVAQELSAQVRSSDGIGRYGGEEFLVVFPETDISVGRKLSEKLRRAVEKIDFQSEDGRRIKVQVSIGMADLSSCSGPGDDLALELIRVADRQLYRAKERGRNRVEPCPAADATTLSGSVSLFKTGGALS